MALYLYQRKNSRSWYIRGTDFNGNSIFETTKTSKKTIAEKFLAKKHAQILDEALYGKKATVTFAEAAQSYVQSGAPRRFMHHAKTGVPIGPLKSFAGKPLRTITQSDLDRAAIEAYPDARLDTRNRQFYTPFVAVWNHACGNEWADYRKWKRPKKPKGTNVIVKPSGRAGNKPVTYDRAAEFVLAMSPANAIVMTILFYTGMRPIELFSLDCSDVDVKDRWITIKSSKTGEPRGVPVHKSLVPLLAALKKRGGKLVRQWSGREFVVRESIGGQMKKAIAGARKRSGITDVSPYTARHTVSTQLVANGVHPHIKDQILGHAVTDMSRHYTNLPQKELISAIDTLPVVKAWANAPWMKDPVGLTGRKVPPSPVNGLEHQPLAAFLVLHLFL